MTSFDAMNNPQASWAFSGQNIGAPALPGSAGYAPDNATGVLADGTFTLTGAGSDIGGTADQCYLLGQTLTGTDTLVLRTLSQENTHANAKAG